MKDAAGNRLEKGHLVWWLSRQLKGRVLDVQESRLSAPGEPDKPPTVLLEVEVMVANPQRGTPPDVVPDFLRIVDPDSERLLEQIAGGRKRPQ